MLGMLSECLSRFAPQVLRGVKFSRDVFLVDIATLLIPGRGQVRRADGDNCCPPPPHSTPPAPGQDRLTLVNS